MGLLADIFSTADTAKRRLSGLLSDPMGTLALGVTRFGEDQGGLLNMTQNAYPMAGNKTVLNSPQQIADFRKQVADKGAEMAMQAATVWHGSPHKFDKFDSSKIGTGEGKQQQGIGSYLAESQIVGQKYADKEAWKRGMDSGYLYKVDAPDSMLASMASHDLPLSSQPENVKKALAPMLDADSIDILKKYHGWENPNDAPFSAIMDALEIAKGNNRSGTSEALAKAGIPGIRYLDGGSRGTGAGTSNFVVFPGNEGLLQILERNGQAVK